MDYGLWTMDSTASLFPHQGPRHVPIDASIQGSRIQGLPPDKTKAHVGPDSTRRLGGAGPQSRGLRLTTRPVTNQLLPAISSRKRHLDAPPFFVPLRSIVRLRTPDSLSMFRPKVTQPPQLPHPPVSPHPEVTGCRLRRAVLLTRSVAPAGTCSPPPPCRP
jgi:hypothetical protein